jgi:hypothetical protein
MPIYIYNSWREMVKITRRTANPKEIGWRSIISRN